MAARTRARSGPSHHDPAPRSLRPVSRPEQGARARAAPPGRSTSKPAWTLLYALLPLCAALSALVGYIPPTGLRTLAQGVIVVIVIGLAAVWVHANRCALSCALSQAPADSGAQAPPLDIALEIHTPSPRVIHLEPRRSRVEG